MANLRIFIPGREDITIELPLDATHRLLERIINASHAPPSFSSYIELQDGQWINCRSVSAMEVNE